MFDYEYSKISYLSLYIYIIIIWNAINKSHTRPVVIFHGSGWMFLNNFLQEHLKFRTRMTFCEEATKFVIHGEYNDTMEYETINMDWAIVVQDFRWSILWHVINYKEEESERMDLHFWFADVINVSVVMEYHVNVYVFGWFVCMYCAVVEEVDHFIHHLLCDFPLRRCEIIQHHYNYVVHWLNVI